MNSEDTLTPFTKINSKWLKDLNMRRDTVQLLDENTGKTFLDINQTNVFLGQSLKIIELKAKKQWYLIKLISFCTTKETIDKTQNNLKTRRKYFQPMILTRAHLIFKIYKQLIQLNNKKPNNPSKNGQKT